MIKKIKKTDYVEADDHLHQPSNELKWREAYYWNWVDLENKISGFSTIGIVPNEQRREFVFLLFWDGKREFYYREPESELEQLKNDINLMLQEKKLAYKCIKPLQTWQILYNSRKIKLELTFDTRFYLYDFGRDSSASWHRHFEASGKITGEITFRDGTTKKISGYGQRDKSWGYRDWFEFDKWYATHFQFKDWNCGMRKDYRKNRIDLSGSVSDKDGTLPLTEFEIETVNDTDKFNSPLTATYYMKDKGGNEYNIEAERLNKNSFVRFARQFPGGYTELFEQMVIMKNLDTGEIGTGMMEHLRTIKES